MPRGDVISVVMTVKSPSIAILRVVVEPAMAVVDCVLMGDDEYEVVVLVVTGTSTTSSLTSRPESPLQRKARRTPRSHCSRTWLPCSTRGRVRRDLQPRVAFVGCGDTKPAAGEPLIGDANGDLMGDPWGSGA